jgi:hypothetical protein
MAGYGIDQNYVKPVPGVDTQAVGAAKLDTILDSIESTLSAKVTPSGMDVNSTLSMRSGSTYSGLTDAHRLGLHPAATISAATYPAALYSNTAGELYYNDNAGNQVQMTDVGFVKAAAGNIGSTGSPAYSTSSVQILWNAASGYHFYGDLGVYSKVWCDTLEVTDSGYSVSIFAPVLATDWDLTLPAAPPASTSVVLMDAGGVLSLTRALSVDTVATSGLITAGAGLTASVNQHVTVSGNGTFKHGGRTVCRPMLGGNGDASPTTNQPSINFGVGEYWNVPLQLEVGWDVSSVSVYLDPAGAGMVIALISIAENGGTSTIGFRVVASGTESDYAITGAAFTVAADKAYYVQVQGANVGDKAHLISLVYSQP